jgi:hypothetical protein
MDALLASGRPSRSELASGEQPHEAIDKAAADQVGHKGQQRCCEKHFEEVDTLVNNCGTSKRRVASRSPRRHRKDG